MKSKVLVRAMPSISDQPMVDFSQYVDGDDITQDL
jgi:hypothetical protein